MTYRSPQLCFDPFRYTEPIHQTNMIPQFKFSFIFKPCGSLLRRSFYTSAPCQRVRIYDSIRNQGDFHTALRLSTTANVPLITIWTAGYCPSCRTVEPRIREILESRPDDAPDLQYVEVKLDAQGGEVQELGLRYMVRLHIHSGKS